MYTLLNLSSTNNLPLKRYSVNLKRSLNLYTTTYGKIKSSMIDRSSKQHMIKFSVIGKYRGRRMKLYEISRFNPENRMTLSDIYEERKSIEDLF